MICLCVYVFMCLCDCSYVMMICASLLIPTGDLGLVGGVSGEPRHLCFACLCCLLMALLIIHVYVLVIHCYVVFDLSLFPRRTSPGAVFCLLISVVWCIVFIRYV